MESRIENQRDNLHHRSSAKSYLSLSRQVSTLFAMAAQLLRSTWSAFVVDPRAILLFRDCALFAELVACWQLSRTRLLKTARYAIQVVRHHALAEVPSALNPEGLRTLRTMNRRHPG
jgi:hypothetical protein